MSADLNNEKGSDITSYITVIPNFCSTPLQDFRKSRVPPVEKKTLCFIYFTNNQ